MTAGRIRTAVVGLGWAGRSIWLPRLLEHADFEVVAAVDPDPVTRASAARDDGDTPLLASVDELSRSSVDLAIVAVPNHLHARVACGLLHRGVPVFLEKPVCLDSAEADRLATAEQEGGAVLLAGSAARYRADVECLHGLVDSLGAIRHIDLSWIRARGVPDAGGWFTRRDLSGGGALVDLGWHLLDTLVPLVGSLDFDQVVGTVSDDFVGDNRWRASWRHDRDAMDSRGDVEDTARGFLVSANGVSVALRASWASHEPLDVTRITVEGSEGTAPLRCTFGFSPNRQGGSVLTLTRDGAAEPRPVPDEEIGAEYRKQLDVLPALLADPASAGTAIAEVHRTIAVIEQFYESAHRAPTRRTPVAAG